MKNHQAPSGALLVALTVLGIALWSTFPQQLGGQVRSHPHDLSAEVILFDNYEKDFKDMEHLLRGQDFEVFVELEHVATLADDRLYSVNAALQMYDSISSQPDRERAKPILKDQLLDHYALAFDQEAARTTEMLTIIKVPAPAAAELGLRMKDDLRAAKGKLDAIAASLDE